jgi:hypothetical protein
MMQRGLPVRLPGVVRMALVGAVGDKILNVLHERKGDRLLCFVRHIAVQIDSSMLEAKDLPCFRQNSQIGRQICLAVNAPPAHAIPEPKTSTIHSKRGQSASNKHITEFDAVAQMPKVEKETTCCLSRSFSSSRLRTTVTTVKRCRSTL